MKKNKYEILSVETVSIVSTDLIAISFSGDTGDVGDGATGDSFEDLITDETSSWD